MAENEDKWTGGLPNPPRPTKSGHSKRVDPQLSISDHRTLERAIRGSVSSIVGASHPDHSSHHHRQGAPVDDDLMLHPEYHPLARQMPGADHAIGYRVSLLNCLIDPDPRLHRRFIEELLRASVPVRTLAVHLFAPVATELGHRWCSDEADFMQVAVASTRLSMIVNHVSHTGSLSMEEPGAQRRILLARTHGAQHTIGVSIVASCFRDMGWAVDGGSDLEIDEEIYARLSDRPYDLLGISVSRVDEARDCSEVIRRVQAGRKTRRMKIAVGGPAVVASPMAFQRIGADFVTRSALDVMQLASHL
jgi:methylmalonyl-CoA mutase cobalamin-binding subunit